jgi:hypothetical protein
MANIIGALPVNLQDGTTADAAQVMSDFNFIVNQVNANAVASGFISPGSLVNVQIFTASGTYTPNANATKAIVKGVGGGGAGGGTNITGPASTAAGGGGGSGAYGEIYISSGLTTETVTVGAGGTPNAGGAGGNGGTSVFGGLMVLPGGSGGGDGSTVSAYPAASGIGPGSSGPPSGTGTFLLAVPGQGGKSGVPLGNGLVIPGSGGSNPIGNGGQGTLTTGTSVGLGGAQGYGSGGAGFTSFNNAANQAGYAGAPGIMLVFEYA